MALFSSTTARVHGSTFSYGTKEASDDALRTCAVLHGLTSSESSGTMLAPELRRHCMTIHGELAGSPVRPLAP